MVPPSGYEPDPWLTNAQAASRAARRPRRVELIPPGDVSAYEAHSIDQAVGGDPVDRECMQSFVADAGDPLLIDDVGADAHSADDLSLPVRLCREELGVPAAHLVSTAHEDRAVEILDHHVLGEVRCEPVGVVRVVRLQLSFDGINNSPDDCVASGQDLTKSRE